MTVPRPRPGCPSSPGSWTRARSSRRSARSGCTCPPQLRPDHGRQHLTPAITASRNSARASGPHYLAELRGQRGQRMQHGRGRHATRPHLHRTRPKPFPAAALRPRPLPSRRVTYYTMPNPRLQRRSPTRRSKTVRCKCLARRPYQQFQCAAHPPARKGVTARRTIGCWQGWLAPVRAADGDDRVSARDRGGEFPEAAYPRFVERKLREEFIL